MMHPTDHSQTNIQASQDLDIFSMLKQSRLCIFCLVLLFVGESASLEFVDPAIVSQEVCSTSSKTTNM